MKNVFTALKCKNIYNLRCTTLDFYALLTSNSIYAASCLFTSACMQLLRTASHMTNVCTSLQCTQRSKREKSCLQ